MIHPFLYSQPQSQIDRISNLYTNILNISNSSGLSIEERRRHIYQFELPLMYTTFSVFREPFTEFLIGIIGPPPESAQQMVNAFYLLTTDSQIIQFITTVFNNQTEIVSEVEAARLYTSIVNRILFPPPTPANTRPNVPNPINTNRNVRTIDEVNRDLTYLFGLGLTATSDNDSMRNTIRRYRELTGRDYTLPVTTVSREELEKDLEYLFGLGLTANSGNDTLNERLAKYRELTGRDYTFPATTVSPLPTTTVSREELERELKYLFSLGITANSGNNQLNELLAQYRELTGRDYTFPATTVSPLPTTTVSRKELERELEYLFSLGITANSGKNQLNELLAQYRELTGTEYVYNQAGGKYRRKKSKTLRKKNCRMNRKSRRMNRKSRNL
jgi:hypothetical protein